MFNHTNVNVWTCRTVMFKYLKTVQYTYKIDVGLLFRAEGKHMDIYFRNATCCTCKSIRSVLLTWNMRPMTKTIATQDTISAWFWIKNSWLRIGGFLLLLERLGAIFTSGLSTGDVAYTRGTQRKEVVCDVLVLISWDNCDGTANSIGWSESRRGAMRKEKRGLS